MTASVESVFVALDFGIRWLSGVGGDGARGKRAEWAVLFPATIVVSVKEIGIGDDLKAGDIELPDGVKLTTEPETLMVTCGLVAAAKRTDEIEEEIPTAPEIIGEDKDEGESSEEEDK